MNNAHISELRAEASGRGVLVNGPALVTVRNSYAANNGTGFSALNAAATLNLENVTATINNVGVEVGNNGTVRVSNSFVVSNNTGLDVLASGGTMRSLGGNAVDGNPVSDAFTSTNPKT